YRDAKQAALELEAGLVSFVFFDATSTVGNLASGLVRALAVTSPVRVPAMPDVPTMQEAGLDDYEMVLTWGVMAPAGLPGDIVAKLEAAFNKIAADPETIEFVTRLGAVPFAGSAEDLQHDMAKENDKWADYARLANI